MEVFNGEETPYYYSGDGAREAYIRIGNESVVAEATELKRLVLRGKNSSFDSLKRYLLHIETYRELERCPRLVTGWSPRC